MGGYAVAFHGAPRYTQDIDVCYQRDTENARAILAALDDFGFGSLDITIEDLVPGDTFLLCSDGLSDMVEDHEMAEIVNQAADLQSAVVRLVDFANERGGVDNITAALVRAG